ncbi:GIY-YIG nuclease family protein [Thermoflavifilum aggregans]|uniref:GIY-YIG nuclease family protein n=1 Tax=Thermoflavifilum aggregans TaxID=454188 RepID=UPI000C2346DE
MKKEERSRYQVYVLRSRKDGRFYVGMSGDVERRLSEHNRGQTRSTRAYRPWELIWVEGYDTRSAAREREKYLKSGVGKEWIKRKWSGSSAG